MAAHSITSVRAGASDIATILRARSSSPATQALPAFALELDGDDALVDTAVEVDPGMRFT